VARGHRPSCHCFGQLHAAPVGWSTLGRNGLLAAVAGLIAADGQYLPAFAGVGVIAAAVWIAPRLIAAGSSRVGRPAPSFSLPDVTGQRWTLDALLAPRRTLVLLFSNPDCPGCTALLPDVARWQALEERLTVAIVSGGSRQANLAKAREHGLRRLLVDEHQTLLAAYGVTATPAAVLISPDGTTSSSPALGATAIAALVASALRTGAAPVMERRELLGRAARAVAGCRGAAGVRPGVRGRAEPLRLRHRSRRGRGEPAIGPATPVSADLRAVYRGAVRPIADRS